MQHLTQNHLKSSTAVYAANTASSKAWHGAACLGMPWRVKPVAGCAMTVDTFTGSLAGLEHGIDTENSGDVREVSGL